MVVDNAFILKNYKEQIDAFNDFIHECQHLLPNKDMSLVRFGGGTALAIYYFQHRRSFDIDLFVVDPQILSYLSPKHWIEDSPNFNANDYFDRFNHIRVLSKNKIKIDILVAQDFIDEAITDKSKLFFDTTVYVESIEDILAKKIIYRKEQNKARDIIDLGVAFAKDPFIFSKLLDKGAIYRQDLTDLYSALTHLNQEAYLNEVSIVEPFETYKIIATESPHAIKAIIKTYLK